MNKREILEAYRTLDPENLYYPKCLEYYSFVANISQHTHFLKNVEAEDIIRYKPKMSLNEKIQFKVLEKKILRSFESLFSKFELYTYTYLYPESPNEPMDKVDLLKIEVYSKIKEIVSNGLREKKEFRLLVPQLSSIILSDYDSEIVIYTNIEESTSRIFSHFKDEGLYLLPNRKS